MSRKGKFRPEVKRIRLNPEQAVLTCNCYFIGSLNTAVTYYGGGGYITQCDMGAKTTRQQAFCSSSGYGIGFAIGAPSAFS